MDTITQMALGAAVGESMLGQKAGYRAAAWGAFLGTLPDLDILANPFLDTVGEIQMHRGITHSLLFIAVASPFIAIFINRYHRQLQIGWKLWGFTVSMIFLTHVLIDITTTYGTQFLYPFTDYPFSTDSIFIIDPFFSVPLFIGLITALFLKQGTRPRQLAVRSGLLISTLYLVWGLGIKAHVHSVYDASFKNKHGYYQKIKSTPLGPASFLWTGYLVKEDTLYQANYSIFDESTDLDFRKIPRNTHLIETYRNDRALKTLLWFSRGYYTVEEKKGELYFYDLRFGRNDFWLTDNQNTDYVWVNRILFDEEGNAHNFELYTPDFNARISILRRFVNRSMGQ